MSNGRRIAVSLSDGERQALAELARRRSEPAATTAARLVRAGLADAGAILDTPPARRRSAQAPDARTRAPAWLPPASRAAAVAALRERYPLEFRSAPDDLVTDRLVAERLAALSVLRDELDAGLRRDPREELAFSAEIAALARWLEERGRRRLAGRSGV